MLLGTLDIFLLNDFVLRYFLLPLNISFSLRFRALFSLIGVLVFYFLGLNAFKLLTLGEGFDATSKDFLHAGQTEQEEGVGHMSDIQSLEGENERKLMFFVVAAIGSKASGGLINQALVSE